MIFTTAIEVYSSDTTAEEFCEFFAFSGCDFYRFSTMNGEIKMSSFIHILYIQIFPVCRL